MIGQIYPLKNRLTAVFTPPFFGSKNLIRKLGIRSLRYSDFTIIPGSLELQPYRSINPALLIFTDPPGYQKQRIHCCKRNLMRDRVARSGMYPYKNSRTMKERKAG